MLELSWISYFLIAKTAFFSVMGEWFDLFSLIFEIYVENNAYKLDSNIMDERINKDHQHHCSQGNYNCSNLGSKSLIHEYGWPHFCWLRVTWVLLDTSLFIFRRRLHISWASRSSDLGKLLRSSFAVSGYRLTLLHFAGRTLFGCTQEWEVLRHSLEIST